jgi:hypothetical protein
MLCAAGFCLQRIAQLWAYFQFLNHAANLTPPKNNGKY